MMKEAKYSAVGSSSTNGSQESPRGRSWKKTYFKVGLICLAGVSAIIVLSLRENAEGSNGLLDDFKRMIYPPVEGQQMPQHWNYSSHSFQPNVLDWNEQRATWMDEHPSLRPRKGERPRVLMVTASSPDACDLFILSHLLLRAAKNKQDYCRLHDMELYYSMSNPDPDFSDWWVKLPVTRMLMLQHPEVEWIWWLDADAVLTNMSFEPPFPELDHYNLVLSGEDRLVYDNWDRTGLSTGAFMIRNCQWSLDLLDAWGSMGTASRREESGKFQSEVVSNRLVNSTGDDQSGLVVLLAQDKTNPVGKQNWAPQVKLVKESEYSMNGNWTAVGPELEEFSLDKHQAVPFVTHFEGCLPSCTTQPEFTTQRLDACVEQLERAFDFAGNQVFEKLGRQPHALGNSSGLYALKDTSSENGENPAAEKEYRILPTVTHWDQWRQAYMENNTSIEREDVMLVSGSTPKPCTKKEGSHLLIRGFKNQVDYGRVHGIQIFYNMAVIHKDLTGWWSKLPLLKIMMLNNPAVEWIWWLDSDAVLTKMDFDMPFARYNASGYNLVMWGVDQQVYDLKKYNGLNTGNYLIRNCQWSLDLLDRWASFGASEELKIKTMHIIDEFLDRPPGWAADDQSSLVYLLIIEREKWASKVFFENVIVMSGTWTYWTGVFVDEYKLRPEDRPFVTHFAGCHPCKSEVGFETCLEMMDRAYNFADNQVLEKYGLRHEHLNSSRVTGNNLGFVHEWTEADVFRLVNEAKKALEQTKEDQDTRRDEKVDKSEKEESAKNEEEVAATKEDSDRGKQQEAPREEEVSTTAKEELDKSKDAEQRMEDPNNDRSTEDTKKVDKGREETKEEQDTKDEKVDKSEEKVSAKIEGEVAVANENLDEAKEEPEAPREEEASTTAKEESDRGKDAEQRTEDPSKDNSNTAKVDESHTTEDANAKESTTDKVDNP